MAPVSNAYLEPRRPIQGGACRKIRRRRPARRSGTDRIRVPRLQPAPRRPPCSVFASSSRHSTSTGPASCSAAIPRVAQNGLRDEWSTGPAPTGPSGTPSSVSSRQTARIRPAAPRAAFLVTTGRNRAYGVPACCGTTWSASNPAQTSSCSPGPTSSSPRHASATRTSSSNAAGPSPTHRSSPNADRGLRTKAAPIVSQQVPPPPGGQRGNARTAEIAAFRTSSVSLDHRSYGAWAAGPVPRGG